MQTIFGLEELRQRLHRPVITIGNFDGVHLGHRALFEKTLARAEAVEGTSVALTFEPHPMRVLRPAVNLPLITPMQQKLNLIAEMGIDIVLCIRFDEDFARLSADDFVDKLLVNRLGVAEVVVGYNFNFGRKGLGDLDLLQDKALQHGFKLHVESPVMIDERPVSSTRVRQLVAARDLDCARKLLGRHYRIAGKVVTGHGRGGRLLGFPTANLKLVDELLPGAGVYAVLVEHSQGKLELGVTNIGSNPTFENGGLHVETHLLDFKGDLYGKDIFVNFVAHLRPEKKFNSASELAEQITQDVEQARRILAPWQSGELDPAVN